MNKLKLIAILTVAAITGCGGASNDNTEPTPAEPQVVQTKILAISMFGQGDIADTTAAIPCDSHSCTKEYNIDSKVVLSATPKAGWTFDRWSGCDTVVGSQCTLLLTQDRAAAPVFLRSVETKFNPAVVPLTTADIAGLAKNEAGVLTFTQSAPSAPNFKVGDVLLSTQDEGLARRVTSIVRLPAGNTIVNTTGVTITDVVAEGSFYFNTKSKTSANSDSRRVQALRITSLASGVKPAASWTGEYDRKSSLEVDIKLYSPSKAKKLEIKGAIDLTLNLEIGSDISLLNGVNEFRVAVNPTFEPNLSITGSLELFKGEKVLATVVGIPIALGPIVILPEYTIKLTYEGKVAVEVNFLSQYKGTASAGFAYVKGYGFNRIWSGGFDPSPFSPGGSGEVSVDVMGGLGLGLKVWGVAGPTAIVGGYFHAEGTADSNNDCLKLRAELGYRAKVGGEIRVISWNIGSFEWTIEEAPLTTLIDKNLTSGCNTQPIAPSKIIVNIVDPRSLRVVWTAPAASAGVVAYEIYRAGRFVTRTSKLDWTDTGLETGKQYCYDVRSRDINGLVSKAVTPICSTTSVADTFPPSIPVLTSATALSTTAIRLQWVPSSDNVAVRGYTVYMNGLPINSGEDISLDVLRLVPATRYCFTARAYDVAGNLSGEGTQLCGNTLQPQLAAWTLMLKCSSQTRYVVTKPVDIDLESAGNISVTGQAVDYNGGAMSYHLFGGYESGSGVFQGKINWAFANSSNVREDNFSINLRNTDTGDVGMQQVKSNGCDASIRLKRN